MIDRADCWEVGMCWIRRIIDCSAHRIWFAVAEELGSQARLADTEFQLQVLELEYSLLRQPRLSARTTPTAISRRFAQQGRSRFFIAVQRGPLTILVKRKAEQRTRTCRLPRP